MSISSRLKLGRFWGALPIPVLSIRFLEQSAFFLLYLFLTQRYLAEDLRLGVAFAGYVITVFGLTKLVAQAPTGWLGDRIGYRRSLMMGLTASLLATALMMGLAEAWIFLAATVLFSLGKAPLGPALDATIANLYEEEDRGRVVAWMNASGIAAYLVAGLGGLIALDLAPPQAFFAVAMALNVAALAVATLWLRETAAVRDSAAAGRSGLTLGALLNPRVATWAAIVGMVGFGIGLAVPVAGPYIRDVLRMEMREFVPYLILPAALAAASIIPAGHLADRLGRERPLALALGLGAIGMFGVSLTESVWALMVLATMVMLSYTLAAPAIGAAVMDITDEKTRGMVLGGIATIGGLGGALGPTVGARIYASFAPQDVFVTSGLVLTGAMLISMAYAGRLLLAYEPAPVLVDDD